jgi:hypothetical protein
MKDIIKSLKDIYRNYGVLLVFMILIFLSSLALLIFSIIALNPNAAVVKISYSDVNGYVDGSWNNMFVFLFISVLFGILHNLLIVKVFEKHGDGLAKVFAIMTLMLILGAFVVLARLVGEA